MTAGGLMLNWYFAVNVWFKAYSSPGSLLRIADADKEVMTFKINADA
jgi:hypothetical protein